MQFLLGKERGHIQRINGQTQLCDNRQNTGLWFPGDNRGLCFRVVIRIQWEKQCVAGSQSRSAAVTITVIIVIIYPVSGQAGGWGLLPCGCR